MRLETTGRKELVRWILSRMPDVKVLDPKSLRNKTAAPTFPLPLRKQACYSPARSW